MASITLESKRDTYWPAKRVYCHRFAHTLGGKGTPDVFGEIRLDDYGKKGNQWTFWVGIDLDGDFDTAKRKPNVVNSLHIFPTAMEAKKAVEQTIDLLERANKGEIHLLHGLRLGLLDEKDMEYLKKPVQ